MKRLLIFLLVAFVFPVTANNFLQSRSDTSLFGDINNSSQTDFLPAKQAFQIEQKKVEPEQIHLQFIIAEGYYLYKDRFSFLSDNSKVVINAPVLPEGNIKEDEFFGKVPVYHAILDVVIPISNPDHLPFTLEVKYQGCADKGLCYPMESLKIPVAGLATKVIDKIESQAVNHTSTKGVSFSDSWHSLSLTTLLYYFGFGLLLSLTPCVFPMLPILAGVVLRGQLGTVKAIILASVYILSMALTYAVLGVLIGLFGAEMGLQARLQSPWVLIPFAIFFVIFALAMFGVFELRLPTFITNSINKATDKTHGGSLLGVAILGICSSLVVSPCVSAPFAGILLHISTTGDAVGGGISLFVLGLGMGLPLFIIAAGGSFLLPKAGAWMIVIRNAIGIMLLAVAIYLLDRVLPSYIGLALWGLLASGVAIFLGALDFVTQKTKRQKLAQVLGLFLIVYAVCAWVGAWQGKGDPLKPLKADLIISSNQVETNSLGWQIVHNQEDLTRLLVQANSAEKLVMVDWTADWCVACTKMEHEVFSDPEVKNRLANIQLIRVDLSNMTDQHRQLQNNYKVFGPPTILFFDKSHGELRNKRIVGEMGKNDFMNHLSQLAD